MLIDPEIRALLEQANLAMSPVLLSSAGSALVSHEQANVMFGVHQAIMKVLAADDIDTAMDNAGVDEPRHLDVESLVKARSDIRESIQRILPSDPEADAMADKEFAKAIPMRAGRPIPRKSTPFPCETTVRYDGSIVPIGQSIADLTAVDSAATDPAVGATMDSSEKHPAPDGSYDVRGERNWKLVAMNDVTGRRGLWYRETTDTVNNKRMIELCAGREGDDIDLAFVEGDVITAGHTLARLARCLEAGAQDIGWRAKMDVETGGIHVAGTPSELDTDVPENQLHERQYAALFTAVRAVLKRERAVERIVLDADDSRPSGVGDDVTMYLFSPPRVLASLGFDADGAIVLACDDRSTGYIHVREVPVDGIEAAVDELIAFVDGARGAK